MTLTTSVLTGSFFMPDGLPIATKLIFTLSGWDSEGGTIAMRTPIEVDLVDGALPVPFELWQNLAGLRATYYTVSAVVTDAAGRAKPYPIGKIQVGTDATYALADLLEASDSIVPGQSYTVVRQDEYETLVAAVNATGDDRIATAADRVQTGLDRTQTGLDVIAANAAAAAAELSASRVDLGALDEAVGLAQGAAAEIAEKLIPDPEASGIGLADAAGFIVSEWVEDGINWENLDFDETKMRMPFIQIVPDETHGGTRLMDAAGFYFDLAKEVTQDAEPATPIIPGQVMFSEGAHLWGFSSKAARLLNAESVTVRIAMIGDSWTAKKDIPEALIGKLAEVYPIGGSGWLQPYMGTFLCVSPVTRDSYAGWTEYDITEDVSASHPYGPDGFRIDCSDTSGVVSWSGISAATLNIYYRDTTGTFRHRVDGGSWVTVTGAGTNGPAKSTIAGLLTSTTHTLEIDTTGNTGTVSLFGVHATGIKGVEVVRFGNGGSDSVQMASVCDTATAIYILADIAPDVVHITLGTNDCMRPSVIDGPTYRAAINTLITAWGKHNSNSGVLIIVPPDNGGASKTTPLTDYAAEAIAIHDATGPDFMDCTRLWSSYANESSAGVWLDTFHLNVAGAKKLANQAFHRFYNL